MEIHVINIIYAALPMREQKRQHFHAKTTSAKLYIYIGVGARDLHIDEAHTALDIFRFAVFFFINQTRQKLVGWDSYFVIC